MGAGSSITLEAASLFKIISFYVSFCFGEGKAISSLVPVDMQLSANRVGAIAIASSSLACKQEPINKSTAPPSDHMLE
jgi:hypothetical protein